MAAGPVWEFTPTYIKSSHDNKTSTEIVETQVISGSAALQTHNTIAKVEINSITTAEGEIEKSIKENADISTEMREYLM